MTTDEVKQTHNFMDRSRWPSGPWDDEPDRVEWRYRGFVCLARRNKGLGNWCGYVGVPEGHPWHGQDYDGVDADAHGGLTFASECDGDQERGICHVPDAGEPDHLWWIGFDCAHGGDDMPGRVLPAIFPGAEYRDLSYVKRNVERLADQAARAAEAA